MHLGIFKLNVFLYHPIFKDNFSNYKSIRWKQNNRIKVIQKRVNVKGDEQLGKINTKRFLKHISIKVWRTTELRSVHGASENSSWMKRQELYFSICCFSFSETEKSEKAAFPASNPNILLNVMCCHHVICVHCYLLNSNSKNINIKMSSFFFLVFALVNASIDPWTINHLIDWDVIFWRTQIVEGNRLTL